MCTAVGRSGVEEQDVTSGARRGVAIRAESLRRTVRGDTVLLDDVSLTIEPGELVAIAGGSGTGKTTMLEILAGVRPPTNGRVLFEQVDLYRELEMLRPYLGYVPQDDIIHVELPLERTLRYAASLRLPPGTTRTQIDEAVRDALRTVGLEDRAGVRVGALSGGQRKRASIAVELLTDPRVFFLDEPTSGLDPATASGLVRALRRLADRGATVVFTTHSVQDLSHCDRVVFLGPGGYLASAGTLDDALARFGATSAEELYERVTPDVAQDASSVFADTRGHEVSAEAGSLQAIPPRLPGLVRQWAVLTRRTFETLVRNRLTLAILLGAPAMVVVMFAILFRPGAFAFNDPNPSAIAMILFWITFGGFFFGLTYGLLQIVTERPVVRREHLVGMRVSAYLLSKVTVLLPFLILVVVLMLAVLRALDRLPAAGVATYASLGVTLALDAVVALALGLLTSAAVGNAAQATLALPMLCFPAVLFSGAILPVHVMAGVGAAISAVIPVRWAFEAIGHDLGVRAILAHGGSPLGPPLLHAYGDAGLHSTTTYWAYLTIFGVVLFAAAWATLTATADRSPR